VCIIFVKIMCAITSSALAFRLWRDLADGLIGREHASASKPVHSFTSEKIRHNARLEAFTAALLVLLVRKGPQNFEKCE
jgi:hypothetical protein